MKTQLERVEIECTLLRDHDFTIEHATSWKLLQDWIDQFGKVAVQRLLVAALNKNLFAVAKDERTKAIPLGFEDPRACFWQLADAFCKHWKNRRVNWELHNLFRHRLHGLIVAVRVRGSVLGGIASANSFVAPSPRRLTETRGSRTLKP